MRYHAYRDYSVDPTSGRFLGLRPAKGNVERTEVIIVQNWFEELERLVPTAEQGS